MTSVMVTIFLPIQYDLFSQVGCLHFIYKLLFVNPGSVKFLGELSFKSEKDSLRRGENDARHGPERPFKEQREHYVQDVTVDEDAAEQKQEAFVFKEYHLLLAEENGEESYALVACEGEVSPGKRSEEWST